MKQLFAVPATKLPGFVRRLMERRLGATQSGWTLSSMELTYAKRAPRHALNFTFCLSQSGGTPLRFLLGELEFPMLSSVLPRYRPYFHRGLLTND